MLDFHPWDFIILFFNFLFLFLILRWLLFKPLSKIFREREAATKGALDEAKEMTLKKDNAVAAMNAGIAEAKANAKSEREKLREAGLSQQKESIAVVESEALAMIEKARTELQAEIVRVRTAMKDDVEQLSEDIVRKLVKV
jgi:F-type H+-transporting ATPase subunit b